MSQILNKVCEVDPNNSDAVKECLSLFFQNLPKQSDHNRWLRALDDIINRFPKYCISHRAAIETYIINFLDNNNHFNVIEAAKCAHSLQQVRPPNENTSTPKSCWRSQISLLCNAAHDLIKKLFPKSPSTYRNDLKKQIQPVSYTPMGKALKDIKKVPEDSLDRFQIFLTRLKNIFVFIQAMLVEIYPVAKPIQPQMILDCIVHALSIAHAPGRSLSDLAIMKTEALRTLDALVACLGPNLIPYSPLVFRLVTQTLRWTSDNPADDTKSVRCVAYNSLRQWLIVLHVYKMSDSRASLEDELTTHITNDITPPKKLVELTMGPQPTKNLSKKAKRKLANSQLKQSSIATHMPGEKNKIIKSGETNELAIAALSCAETLFIVCGIFLKPTTHKIFQECLVRECFNLASYSDEQSLCLLRVLEACRKSTPNTVPPPTQYCLHLYSTLVNSTQLEITSFCSRALLDIRLHLHCSPPSLNFALQIAQDPSKDKKKKVSEKNRAVLESLLGKEKLPPNDTGENVITIADEPPTKRQRLSEDADKISLSSENISSVEISDDSDSDVVQEILEVQEEDKEMENEQPITANSDKISEEAKEPTNVQENSDNETLAEITATNTEDELEKDKNESPSDAIEENINIIETQVPETKNVKEITDTIHDAPTQLLNESMDTLDGKQPASLEVAYDYPNTANEKASILEERDDAILPSTNETDDIQITCGQVIQSSLEDNEKRSSEGEIEIEEPKQNGLDVVENGVQEVIEEVNPESASANVLQKKDGLSVEEMMADFVDEVNDDV